MSESSALYVSRDAADNESMKLSETALPWEKHQRKLEGHGCHCGS